MQRKIKTDPITFVAYMEAMIARKYAKLEQAKTKEYYASALNRHIRPFFKELALRDVTAAVIEDFDACLASYTKELKSGARAALSANTIGKYHRIVCTVLNDAARRGVLGSSPARMANPPKGEKPKTGFWDPEDIPAGLALFEGTVVEWHVKTALLTGMRLGEICGLHEDFLDFANGWIDVREQAQNLTGFGLAFFAPKTAASKAAIPMSSEARRVFRARILENKKGRLLCGPDYDRRYAGRLSVRADGSFIGPSYVKHTFRKIMRAQEGKKAPIITFHGLRHTCGARLTMLGVDMKTIQKILRHKDFQTTANFYSDVSKKHIIEAMEKLTLE